MRRLMDTPQAWETLDLRADVIGRRTMKSGRRSIMSRQPLFSLARRVVRQVSPCTLYCVRECRAVGISGLDRGKLEVCLSLELARPEITNMNGFKLSPEPRSTSMWFFGRMQPAELDRLDAFVTNALRA